MLAGRALLPFCVVLYRLGALDCAELAHPSPFYSQPLAPRYAN